MNNIGLIGKFISNSQMPDLMRKLGNEFETPIKYSLFDFSQKKNVNLKNIVNNFKKKKFLGIGVTYPYKEKILEVVQSFGKEVDLTKASNTLIFGNEIVARNTDFLGFVKSLEFHFKNELKNILVIGGGGVGRAVCFGLAEFGVEKIYLMEKDLNKSNKLINELRNQSINCISLKIRDLIEVQGDLEGIVNCTPIGHNSSLGNPLPQLLTSKNQWVYDVVYTPAKTDFLRTAERKNSMIIYGVDLFIFQGIEAYILFTNQNKNRNNIYKQINEIRTYYLKKLVY